jgi:hypothetical protein
LVKERHAMHDSIAEHRSARRLPDFVADFMSQRSRRVVLLVAGIIILSLADLVVTIAFLRANSMMEANPIAAYLIRVTQSAWVLAAYKTLTVLICVALIYKVRKHLAGEVAAWCAVGILAVMSVMWAQYSRQLDDPQHLSLVQTMADDMRLGLP